MKRKMVINHPFGFHTQKGKGRDIMIAETSPTLTLPKPTRRCISMADVTWIKKHGKTAKGKNEYLNYMEHGTKLSPKQAILANCYQCTGCYDSGKIDCQISACPLYGYMPYRKGVEKIKQVRSEKQLEHDKRLAFLRHSAHKTMSGSR